MLYLIGINGFLKISLNRVWKVDHAVKYAMKPMVCGMDLLTVDR
jgi:hypothetical protein